MHVLRSRILRGVYEDKLPGERALAEELGTSPVTLRVALVQLETLGFVRRKQRSGTFVVPAAERAAETKKAFARLILPLPFVTRSDQFSVSLTIQGFQEAAGAHHVTLSLEYGDEVDDVIDRAVGEASAPRCVGTCVILLPLETRHLIHLAAAATPVVVVESYMQEMLLPCLTFDETRAGRLAAEHLVKLGHRRIALAYHERGTRTSEERLQSVEACLHQFGLRPVVKKVVRDLDSGEELRSLLNDPASPTAAVCSSTLMGETLAGIAGTMGRPVPRQFSVVALTGAKLDAEKNVTAVVRDHAVLGRRAFEALLDEELMAHPSRVLVPVELVDTGTTGPPPAD